MYWNLKIEPSLSLQRQQSLNAGKANEMSVNFRRTGGDHFSLYINGSTERQKLEVPKWAHHPYPICILNTTSPSKKAQQQPAKKFSANPTVLSTFCRETVGDCADQLCHSLVWELHCLRLQDPTVDYKDSSEDSWGAFTDHPHLLPEASSSTLQQLPP